MALPARMAVAAFAAAAMFTFSGCGLHPVASADAQGAMIGVRVSWAEMGAAIAKIFVKEQARYGLPNFLLPVADAPSDGKTVQRFTF